MKKLALFLAIAIVLMQLPLISFAEEVVKDGSSWETAIEIDTVEEFEAITTTGLDKYYKLTADIGSQAAPVGNPIGRVETTDSPFTGHIDGGNYTVWVNIAGVSGSANLSGVHADSSTHRGALFPYVSGNAEIKNLTIRGNVLSNYDAAGLIALIDNTESTNTVTIENVKNYAKVRGWFSGAGGIVSYIKGGKFSIENCENHGEIGLGGGASTPFYYGGIVGYVNTISGGSIKNCRNYGRMYEDNTAASKASAHQYVGGIAGFQAQNTYIVNCHNEGNITSDAIYVGGISAVTPWNANTSYIIDNCSNSGAVTGKDFVGGITGRNWGPVRKSFNVGDITATADTGYAAGISAQSQYASTAAISYCYNTGLITGATNAAIVTSGTTTTTGSSGLVYSNCYNANINVASNHHIAEGQNHTSTNNYNITENADDDEYTLTLDELKEAASKFAGKVFVNATPNQYAQYNLPQIVGNNNRYDVALYKVTASVSSVTGGAVDKAMEYVWRNDTFEAKITPEAGYLISSLTINGEPAEVMPDDPTQAYDYIIESATSDVEIEVAFEAYRATPEMISGGDLFITDKPLSLLDTIYLGPKVIAFATSLGAYKQARKEFGMYFSENIADLEEATRDLAKAEKAVASEDKITTDGKYGVMFYGSDMNAGNTYYALPYAVWDNKTADDTSDDITVYGNIIEMTIPAE